MDIVTKTKKVQKISQLSTNTNFIIAIIAPLPLLPKKCGNAHPRLGAAALCAGGEFDGGVASTVVGVCSFEKF